MNTTIEKKTKTKTGILLINLGTPDSYSTSDIRKYLDEFLMDPRVVDIPLLGRLMLVKGIILPTRPAKIAPSYKEIWLEDGSPLLVYGKKVKEELQKRMGDDYVVELGMRYGNPSIEKSLETFKNYNIENLKIIPLFPQYASASTASVIEKLMSIMSSWQNIPSMKIKSYFYDDPHFINAFVELGKKYLDKKYDHILFSYHGLPERQLKAGSNHCNFGSCCETITEKNQYCYRAQCYQTTYLMVDKLGLDKKDYSVSFQSRLGRTPWIKPYTDETIKELAKKGIKNLLVFSPSFVSDCLETSYEIKHEYNKLFQEHGGENVTLVESLNAEEVWIEALKNIILEF
jgi:ferrochelatase